MFIPAGTEVHPVTTTGHIVNQPPTLGPAPLQPPDPHPKEKRASPGPTARLRTSTQPPAPRISLRDALHPAPTLDPCPGHALAPGPGLDASLEATDCLFPQSPDNLSPRMFLLSYDYHSVVLYICICLSSH